MRGNLVKQNWTKLFFFSLKNVQVTFFSVTQNIEGSNESGTTEPSSTYTSSAVDDDSTRLGRHWMLLNSYCVELDAYHVEVGLYWEYLCFVV